MELYQIRYFLAVSRTLNFTRAAEECNLTQPALTRAVKKLEDELGGELFRRERSRSHLTDLGKIMVPFLQQSYDASLAAKAEAENFGSGDVAPLSIGISHTVPASVLERVLFELQRVTTGLNFNLERASTTEISRMLEAGDVDFCVVPRAGDPWDRAEFWDLFEEDYVICSGNSEQISGKSHESFHGPVVDRPYCEHNDEICDYIDGWSDKPTIRHRISSDMDARLIVGKNGSFTIMPRSTALECEFSFQPLENSKIRRSIVLMSAAGRRHSGAGTRFLQLMRAANWSTFDS